METVYKIITRVGRKSSDTIGKYKLHYPKGEVVKALDGTMGIFCCKTKEIAEFLIPPRACNKYIIILVSPIGEEAKPNIISSSLCPEDLDEFYQPNHDDTLDCFYCIPNVVCYPAVKVLE